MPARRAISRLKRSKSINKPKVFTLRDFWEHRNKILIIRAVGGLGDILMHRMMFEGFKKIMPSAEIHFACPKRYHDAVNDHPFLDAVLDSDTLDKPELIDAIAFGDKEREITLRKKGYFLRRDYVISYITTTACGRAELTWSPFSKLHRSDIWSQHCGVELDVHNMHININQKDKEAARALLAKSRYNNGKMVLFCPISAMEGKNLVKDQITTTVQGLLQRGYCVLGLHSSSIQELDKLKIPVLNPSLKTWIALIQESDYIVTVDSAALHCAGGLNKPTVGVFSWADGAIYTKYYAKTVVVRKQQILDNWRCPCYNWGGCPLQKEGHRKPCITEITPNMVLEAFDKLVELYP